MWVTSENAQNPVRPGGSKKRGQRLGLAGDGRTMHSAQGEASVLAAPAPGECGEAEKGDAEKDHAGRFGNRCRLLARGF